jgi:small subunit ribosomal protein S21
MNKNKLHGRLVLVQDGNVEKALRKFKKKIQTSGLLDDLRNRECYVKPTTERKLKAAAAKKRWQRKLRDQELPKKLF